MHDQPSKLVLLLVVLAISSLLFGVGVVTPALAEIAKAFENWTVEVCEAEFMETTCRRNLDTTLEAYQRILWGSMADAEACARLGALCGGGSTSEVEALAGFGRRLGFMYRIADDMKDTLNAEGNLPDRLERESVPLPILYTAKFSKENYSKVKTVLDKQRATPSDVKELLKLCFETEAFAYAYKLAKQNKLEMRQKLRLLKPSEARNVLSLMAKKAFEDVDSLCL